MIDQQVPSQTSGGSTPPWPLSPSQESDGRRDGSLLMGQQPVALECGALAPEAEGCCAYHGERTHSRYLAKQESGEKKRRTS